MTKYKEYFQKMLGENAELFSNYRQLHNEYKENIVTQEEYNDRGKPVLAIIREYEDRLCRQTESGGYSVYSGNLAEKFWDEIRREFPLVDRIGIIVKKVNVETADEEFILQKIETFSLKKITLS